jgi:predicted transcriptional regulator of viral defense system
LEHHCQHNWKKTWEWDSGGDGDTKKIVRYFARFGFTTGFFFGLREEEIRMQIRKTSLRAFTEQNLDNVLSATSSKSKPYLLRISVEGQEIIFPTYI